MFKRKTQIKSNIPHNLPAPTMGLDAVSPLMAMKENRAILMENWFPMPDGVEMRDGFVSHVTGFADTVERLHIYSAANGGESLWATTASGIYNATTLGAVGATVMALTEGKTISTVISTGAGNYMMVANGVDTIKQYDGTTWSSIATFGATATSTYSFVETYRQRLFLVKKNSLELEYLAVNSISGAATNYPLGAILNRGGYIVAIGTWTIDGGSGPEDQLVAITSEGQVAVFAGSDPSTAATWALRGVYNIGIPMGANCLFKYGGDLLVLTEAGIYPMSSAVQSASIDRTQGVSAAIKPIFSAAANSFSANDGWQIISDSNKPFLLVNVPSTPRRKQFVMHSQTGAWTTFVGWDAFCFARLNEEIYFGTATEVCRVNGNSDKGANITATLMQAHSRFRHQQTKKVELTKAYISSNGGFSYAMGYGLDFSDPREKNLYQAKNNVSAAIWGVSIFGEAIWTGVTGISQDWQTVPDDYSLWKALYLQCVSNNAKIRYYGSDMLILPGSNL